MVKFTTINVSVHIVRSFMKSTASNLLEKGLKDTPVIARMNVAIR